MTASRLVKLAEHTWVDPVEVAAVEHRGGGDELSRIVVVLRSGVEITVRIGSHIDGVVLQLDPGHRMPEGSS